LLSLRHRDSSSSTLYAAVSTSSHPGRHRVLGGGIEMQHTGASAGTKSTVARASFRRALRLLARHCAPRCDNRSGSRTRSPISYCLPVTLEESRGRQLACNLSRRRVRRLPVFDSTIRRLRRRLWWQLHALAQRRRRGIMYLVLHRATNERAPTAAESRNASPALSISLPRSRSQKGEAPRRQVASGRVWTPEAWQSISLPWALKVASD
jgi:hypothetical protein